MTEIKQLLEREREDLFVTRSMGYIDGQRECPLLISDDNVYSCFLLYAAAHLYIIELVS